MTVLKAARDQQQRMADDLRAWAILKELADNGQCVAFFRAYAAYLQENQEISERRQSLVRVFKRAADLLESSQ